MEGTPGYKRWLVTLIYLAARIAIARSWKSPTIQFSLVKSKLSWIMVNERLLAGLNDKIAFFDKIWDPWIKYLSDDA